jgi:hypothetical protein
MRYGQWMQANRLAKCYGREAGSKNSPCSGERRYAEISEILVEASYSESTIIDGSS